MSMQACREPVPELLVLVTLQTTPPRPPVVAVAPNPSASGNARRPVVVGGGGGSVTVRGNEVERVISEDDACAMTDTVPVGAVSMLDSVQVVELLVVEGHDPVTPEGRPDKTNEIFSVMLVRLRLRVGVEPCPL